MAKSAIFDMKSFFYFDIFENGLLYRKVLVENFQKMYRFNTTGLTVDEINAFKISRNLYFLLSQHFFWDIKCIYLVNGMSDSIKHIHFLKLLKKDFTIKQTVFKYIQVEKMTSYQIWRMLPYFHLKMQISRDRFIQSW